jgi:hypothetical protein
MKSVGAFLIGASLGYYFGWRSADKEWIKWGQELILKRENLKKSGIAKDSSERDPCVIRITRCHTR